MKEKRTINTNQLKQTTNGEEYVNKGDYYALVSSVDQYTSTIQTKMKQNTSLLMVALRNVENQYFSLKSIVESSHLFIILDTLSVYSSAVIRFLLYKSCSNNNSSL